MPFLEDIYNLADIDVVGKAPLKSHVDLDIDANGNVDLNDTGKEGTETMVAIHGLSRNGKQFTPRPFIDDTKYTFGYTFKKNKDGSVSATRTEFDKARHDAYIKCIENSKLAQTDKVVAKYLELLKAGLYETIIEGQSESTVALINQLLLKSGSAIRVCYKGKSLAERYADRFIAKSDNQVFCSFTGKMGTPNAKNPPQLRHLHGGGQFNLNLFSSNTGKYDSLLNYGIENLDEAPLSAEAFNRLHRNLQNVLDNANGHFYYTKLPTFKMDNSKSSYVILFSDHNVEAEKVVNALISSPMGKKANQPFGYNDEEDGNSEIEAPENSDTDTGDNVRIAELLYKAYKDLWNGCRTEIDRDATMTLYTLHCGQARWSVTDEHTLTVKELKKNLDQWFKDTTINGKHFSVWELIRSTCAPIEKGKPAMYEILFMSALFGRELPSTFLRKVTTRITAHTGIATFAQLGLMQLAYNQYARKHNLKEITSMLDHTNKTYPYNLGRLMALTEYAQKKTNPEVKSTISLGKAKLAVMRPTQCEAELHNSFNHIYLPTIARREKNNEDTPRAAVWLSKIHDEINEGLIDQLTQRMTQLEQCLFQRGYRAQMNDFYVKRNTKTETNNK